MTEEKKMPNHQQYSKEFHQFLPATLHHNCDGWQIEYYAYNPIAGKMDRKRILVNRLKKRYSNREFKVIVGQMITTINNKLAGGWSPFGESENVRYYTFLSDVMRLYIEEKSKELKPDSLRSYKSFCKIFGVWCEQHVPKCHCVLFNRTLAIRYMDYVYNDRKVSARGYNNQLKMARAFFSWAVEKCYCKENPFEHIKTKCEKEKKRILIPQETRMQIKRYFEQKRPNFIIVLELIFTSLLRPKEVSRVQIKQVNIFCHSCMRLAYTPQGF